MFDVDAFNDMSPAINQFSRCYSGIMSNWSRHCTYFGVVFTMEISWHRTNFSLWKEPKLFAPGELWGSKGQCHEKSEDRCIKTSLCGDNQLNVPVVVQHNLKGLEGDRVSMGISHFNLSTLPPPPACHAAWRRCYRARSATSEMCWKADDSTHSFKPTTLHPA